MNTLLIITDIDFWRGGAGHRARLSSLIHFLRNKISTTVVYAGPFHERDKQILASSYSNLVVDVLERTRKLSYREFNQQFERYIKDKTFDAVLIEYIELFTVLQHVRAGVLTLLDTHDLVAERIKSFRQNNLPYHGVELTEEEELQIFKRFDYVLAIQKQDHEKISARIGNERALLVPHAITFPRKKIKHIVQDVGYIASEYLPNVHAIIFFIENVWPSVHDEHNLTLNIYGNVHLRLPESMAKYSGVKVHGFTPDLNAAYDQCDIIINPVTAGAGLKIKNVEALAKGLPLITTTHGAAGMEDGAGSAFLVANEKDAIVEKINKLTTDFEFRTRISESAWRYAQQNFSPEECYSQLTDVILNLNRKITGPR